MDKLHDMDHSPSVQQTYPPIDLDSDTDSDQDDPEERNPVRIMDKRIQPDNEFYDQDEDAEEMGHPAKQ